jgi:hypothetical protein
MVSVKSTPTTEKQPSTTHEWNIVHALTSIPSNDGNWTSSANRASISELNEALEIVTDLNNKEKGYKTKLIAIKREIKKRTK